jgi:diguanylate cyclase (GGDEF)-like protein/PAS domain S-box-containing protein
MKHHTSETIQNLKEELRILRRKLNVYEQQSGSGKSDRTLSSETSRAVTDNLQSFLNNVEDMIYFQSLDGDITYINDAHLKITGYGRDDFDADPDLWRKLVDPDQNLRHQTFFRDHPNGIESYESEYQITTKSGGRRWIQSRMLGVRDSSGSFTGYACIDRDITDLKRFEAVLRDLINFRESVIDGANVLFHVLDEENNVIMWNKGAHDITGYSREEVIGNPHIWEWLYPDEKDRQTIFNVYRDVAKNRRTVEDFETVVRTRSGERKVISWYARTIPEDDLHSKGLIALGHDITRRKTAETQLRLLKKNLELEKSKLEQVLDVSHEMSSILELNQLVNLIPEAATKLLEARRCSLMFLDAGTKELSIVSAKGLDREIVDNTRIKIGDSVSGFVAKTGEPLLVKNIEEHRELKQKNRSSYLGHSFVSVPIILHDKVVGVVNVADKTDTHTFTGIDLKILKLIVHQAAISIENATFYRDMEHLSNTDPMTGLYNHRFFVKRLNEEINRTERNREKLALMMIDIDAFKSYNDQFGHLAGDRLLQEISQCILKAVRSFDVACRYAGDEFVVILPKTDAEQALSVGERIRASVNELVLEDHVTISIGISETDGGESGNTLILKADQALYHSKRSGKNIIHSL